jgi:hypothetical protein
MELGIWLSFVKTSEFRGRGGLSPQTPLGTPLIPVMLILHLTYVCTQFHRLLFGTSVPTSQKTLWSPIKTNQPVYVVYGNNREVQEK